MHMTNIVLVLLLCKMSSFTRMESYHVQIKNENNLTLNTPWGHLLQAQQLLGQAGGTS
jgi:hypothetical protein